MSKVMTADGVSIFYSEQGKGETVVLTHGWPLSSETWEAQTPFLSQHDYQVIAYDLRGFGRSDKPEEGYNNNAFADDLSKIIDALDLNEITLVGHAMGAGVVARYLTRYGTGKIKRVVFLSTVTPFMLKTNANPRGLPRKVFDAWRQEMSEDRSQFYRELSIPYYGYNRTRQRFSERLQSELLKLGMQASAKGSYDCIEAFSETDFTTDLKRIDLPTLILHGEADQIVPVQASAVSSAELIAGSELRIVPGAPHGLHATHAEIVNQELLAFLQRT